MCQCTNRGGAVARGSSKHDGMALSPFPSDIYHTPLGLSLINSL